MAANNNGAPPSPRPDISLPVNRPKEGGEWTPEIDRELRAKEANFVHAQTRNAIPRAFFPGGDRSLAGIALRAFLLGNAAVFGIFLSIFLASHGNNNWRPPFFIGTLAVFHFLEFWTTARYNTPIAFVSSFLLTNGSQYRQAHMFALAEALITSYFFPEWQSRINPPVVVALGITMIVVGQVVRSFAMAQAGTNFNHQVQNEKSADHELVTTGLYAYFRHPSYFGFFWWGLGTQVALGNSVSLVGYAIVLWYFFYSRIQHEEKYLVGFFGKDYVKYRERTLVWIPFI